MFYVDLPLKKINDMYFSKFMLTVLVLGKGKVSVIGHDRKITSNILALKLNNTVSRFVFHLELKIADMNASNFEYCIYYSFQAHCNHMLFNS